MSEDFIDYNYIQSQYLVSKLKMTHGYPQYVFAINAWTSFEFTTLERREEGQPQQYLFRATFYTFSLPSHLEILVLQIFFLNV